MKFIHERLLDINMLMNISLNGCSIYKLRWGVFMLCWCCVYEVSDIVNTREQKRVNTFCFYFSTNTRVLMMDPDICRLQPYCLQNLSAHQTLRSLKMISIFYLILNFLEGFTSMLWVQPILLDPWPSTLQLKRVTTESGCLASWFIEHHSRQASWSTQLSLSLSNWCRKPRHSK